MPTLKIDREKEQVVHDYLKELFIGMENEAEEKVLDPDGEFSFSIVGFNKPTKEFAEAQPEAGPATAAGLSLGATIFNACPAAYADEDGDVAADTSLQKGMHVVSMNILANLLREHVLGYVIGNAQQAILEWRAHRDD